MLKHPSAQALDGVCRLLDLSGGPVAERGEQVSDLGRGQHGGPFELFDVGGDEVSAGRQPASPCGGVSLAGSWSGPLAAACRDLADTLSERGDGRRGVAEGGPPDGEVPTGNKGAVQLCRTTERSNQWTAVATTATSKAASGSTTPSAVSTCTVTCGPTLLQKRSQSRTRLDGCDRGTGPRHGPSHLSGAGTQLHDASAGAQHAQLTQAAPQRLRICGAAAVIDRGMSVEVPRVGACFIRHTSRLRTGRVRGPLCVRMV